MTRLNVIAIVLGAVVGLGLGLWYSSATWDQQLEQIQSYNHNLEEGV